MPSEALLLIHEEVSDLCMAMHQGGEAQVCRPHADADAAMMSRWIDPRSLYQDV
jgi:hypothetical protein